MTILLKGGNVINVFTGEIEKTNVLIKDCRIIGVGDYSEAEIINDVSGKYICPGFIDGHIHIESTMLTPKELARVCIPHGTSAIVADPHEIANVCGEAGITYMMQASENLPMEVYYTLPSCVPATQFDENGAVLSEKELEHFYASDRVLGLAEMMNYVGVINDLPEVVGKINQARSQGKIINGHAPLLTGKDLDKYISYGINDDHECSSFEEAVERIRKGQWVMIRQGTSARNLESLIDLFDNPYNHRCLLVTDDKHPYDLMENGHIDSIIRQAVMLGKSPITGIKMATIQAAQCFGLREEGAIAPGYLANILVLNDLNTVDICDVYHKGKMVCKNKEIMPINIPDISPNVVNPVLNSFNIKELVKDDFYIEPEGESCRVIKAIPGELLTEELICSLDFSAANGIDTDKDIIKIAVCERHQMTGHMGIGFISGLGIKKGAIASSVSHDSHNLIIAGADEADMALAGNTVRQMQGGMAVVLNGKVLAKLELPIAGLMSDRNASLVAADNMMVRQAVNDLGVTEGIEPFMNLGFISLPVIPKLKMTTKGLVDVVAFEQVSLFEK